MPPASLPGTLYVWNKSEPALVAFESGDLASTHKVVFLTGLTEGLMGKRYVPALSEAVAAHGWSLVQPLLSSSGTAYGTGSLTRDTEELNEFLEHLSTERGATRVVLIGHSTGCQQITHHCRHGRAALRPLVAGVVLQAPASDREAATMEPLAGQWMPAARRLRDIDKEEELMPRKAHPYPITAARFLSLFDIGGEDDLFSSDLTDAELRERLQPLGAKGRPVLIAFSEADQYVPPTVDRSLLVKRLCRAAAPDASPDAPSHVVGLLIPGADHSLNLPADGSATRAFLDAVGHLLRSLGPDAPP